MNKKLPKSTASKDIVRIPGTKYIILPDNTVARLLTPRTVHGTTYFNLFLNGKYTTTAVANLHSLDATKTDHATTADEQPAAE
jgi:hypothetical protein